MIKSKLFILSLALLGCLGVALAQGPVIEFETTEHDFGTIKEADGRVSTDFVFKNTGMAPLLLSNVRASCGCTTPNWPKEPIEPGQSGKITVTYNATGRPGHFQKTITVTSNASEETVRLFIKGNVTPKESSARALYPVKYGDVSLKSQRIDFSSITQGVIAEKKIEMYNSAASEVKVKLEVPSNNAISSDEITIANGQVGWLNVKVDTRKTNAGIQDVPAYLVINGQKANEKVIVYLDILRDFSRMTVEERQNAPKIDVTRSVDLGEIKAGSSLTKQITVSNNGANNVLIISQIYSANANITGDMGKNNVIKMGKSADIKLTINASVDGTPMNVGDYKKQIIIVSNDPNSPKTTIDLQFKVVP